MSDKFVFVGVGKMKEADVANFIKLFEMNKLEADLAHDQTVKTFKLSITEETEDI